MAAKKKSRRPKTPLVLGPPPSGASAPGRVDAGQEAVVRMESLATRVDHLVQLSSKAKDAAQDYKDAVKKVAENSGLLAATVSRYVKARAGEHFEDAARKAKQLALVFEEIPG